MAGKTLGIFVSMILLLFASFETPNVFADIDFDQNLENPNIAIVGRGAGAYTCQNGTTHDSLGVFFWITTDTASRISGLGLSQDRIVMLAASLDSYTIKQDNTFEINGLIQIDDLCNEESTSITIRGNCQEESLFLEASSRTRGKFVGNIICRS
jgi:hypothetical protein